MTESHNIQTVTMNRALVGSLALVMLVGAGALWFFAGSQNIWTGACLKVGLVMAALWLALPTITRRGHLGQVSWASIIGFMALALVLTGRRVDMRITIPILICVAIAGLLLRPKSKSRSR